MYVSRALRLEQCLCSPSCSSVVLHYKAWLAEGRRWQHDDTKATQSTVPTDPVATQLRNSTEQEVLQLLAQRQGRYQYQEDSRDVQSSKRTDEFGGPQGPEPTRFVSVHLKTSFTRASQLMDGSGWRLRGLGERRALH